MSRKTLIALLVLLAGLGGFFLYDAYWLTPAREKREQGKGRLWTVEPKDIEAITITRKGESVRLKRVDDGWEMLAPVKARGDRGTADELAASLATLRVDREIDPNPAKLSDFGLDPPAAEVSIEVKGRAEPLRLVLGAKNPTGVWVYGREGSKAAVLALSEIAARDTSRPTADFRDKTLLAFDRKSVSGVELDVDGQKIALEPEEGGKWRIARPGPYRADASLVTELLDRLASARVKEFVAEDARALAEYGLDRPTTVTLILGRDKDRTQKSLLFGRANAERKDVYVMRAGEPAVMLVASEVSAAVPRTVAALRDKTVVAYAYDKVNRIEIDSHRGKVTIERDGPGWKIAAPEALKADTGEVNSFLWKVRDLRAAGFLAEDASAIPRYLGAPAVTVKLWEEGATEPTTLLLGASGERRGGEPAAVAAVAGRGPVMLVPGKTLEELGRTAADLRDRTLFPAFEMGDVKQLLVRAGDKRVVAERRSDSDWRTTGPDRGAAKENRVTEVLISLKALRWKEIASAKGDEAARYGLDRPEAEVTLVRKDGSEIGSLLVGKEEGAVTYVRLKASPAIYTVDSKAVAEQRKAPAEIPG
jgi:Domain of unknown function (DUF4340)